MSSPFNVLFPEIWSMLHRELMTPIDARDRVALQRTCKAAHCLDPGLILAPRWLSTWEEDIKEEDIPRCNNLLLDFLRQIDQQMIFDWCPIPEYIRFYDRDESDPDDYDGILMEWRLVKENKKLDIPEIHGFLWYQPANVCSTWLIHVATEEDCNIAMDDSAITLEDLFSEYPKLCLCKPEDIVHAATMSGELEYLFKRGPIPRQRYHSHIL